jgi:hypothetical protein
MRSLPGPKTARPLAVSALFRSPEWVAHKEGTLSQKLRTGPLPVAQLLVAQQVTASVSDAQVDNCDRAEKSLAIHYVADLCPADGDARRAC